MSGPGGNDKPAIGGMFAAALLVVAGLAEPACGEEVLRVCLDANVPQWSVYEGAKGGGFDWAVADMVANRIGRQLALQWFETKSDPDDSTTLARLIRCGALRATLRIANQDNANAGISGGDLPQHALGAR